MKVSITSNVFKAVQGLDDIAQRQIPFAQLATLSQLASRTRKAVYDEMDLVLDPPLKRFTLQSMAVTPATFKTGPVSEVYLKDDPIKRQDKVYGHLFTGGDRRWKNMEGALLRHGLMPTGRYAVPGQGAPLDQYGNIPASFIRSILSYFGSLNEGNMLKSTKMKKSNNQKDSVTGYKTINGFEYFISFGPARMANRAAPKSKVNYQQYQHLPAGIYSRTGIHGVKITPIIMFVPKKKPYRKYIDLYGLGLRVLEQNKDRYFADNLMAGITGGKKFERLVEVSD